MPLLSAFAYDDDDVVAAPTAPLFAVESVERGFREPSVSWPVPEVAPTVRAPVCDVRGAEAFGDGTAEGVRREQLVGEPGAVGRLGDPGGLLELVTAAAAAVGSELMSILVCGHLTSENGGNQMKTCRWRSRLQAARVFVWRGCASQISVLLQLGTSTPPPPQHRPQTKGS